MNYRLLPLMACIFSCCISIGIEERVFAGEATSSLRESQWTCDTSSDFVYWNGPDDSSGYQWYSTENVGFSAAYSNNVLLELAIKTGYVLSHNDSASNSGSVGALTDTTTHFMIAYEKCEGVQPFITFDMNLPTGKATLIGSEKNAIMDRDLVPQTRFGEGRNVNPGIGVTIPISPKITSSLAVGYNTRNSYTPDGDFGYLYDPGDQIIITTGLNYMSSKWIAALNATYTNEGESKLAGVPYFKPGNSYTAIGMVGCTWALRQTTQVSLAFNYTGKNHVTDFFAGGYAEEEKDSNSTLYIASVSHTYGVNDRLSYKGKLSYLLRDKNKYEPESDYFVSAKDKISVELDAQYKFSQTIDSAIGLGLFTLKQDATPYLDSQHFLGVIGHAKLKVLF
jgi:hypothetical protein